MIQNLKNRISVVCPTYNSSSYIGRTLESLLLQSCLPHEIIFSDDGSQDRTVDILESWKERFLEKSVGFTVIKNQHAGPGENRNRGIAQAQGEWIAFLDADDYWHADKIKKVTDVIGNSLQVNFILHWEQYHKMDGQKVLLPHGSAYDLELPLGGQIYKNNAISTSAVTCKKEILLAVGGFDRTLPVSQDYELWLRLSPLMKLSVIEEVLGYYVEQTESITAKPYRKRYVPLMRILFRHRNKGGLPHFLYRVARASLSRQWGRDVLYWLKNEQRH